MIAQFEVDLVCVSGGLPGAVLAVQSESSRKDGPVISLPHTLWVKQPVAEGAPQCFECPAQGGIRSPSGMIA